MITNTSILAILVATLVLMTGCPKKTTTGTDNWDSADKVASSVVYVIEAEEMAKDTDCFTLFEDPEASGKQGMRVPEIGATTAVKGDDPKPDGSLTFTITAAKAMQVSLWLHVKWATECANSFELSLPGGMKRTVTGSTYGTWVWIRGAQDLPLRAGDNPIVIAAREFDCRIDQVAVTEDSNYVPQGIEKSNSNDKAPLKLK